MITERELRAAISECEKAPGSYANCEKLATFYAIHDHMTGAGKSFETLTEETVGDYNGTTFGEAISGRPAAEMWAIMDELMEALQVVNPRLYEGVMRKIRG